jgi:hypothetical protein
MLDQRELCHMLEPEEIKKKFFWVLVTISLTIGAESVPKVASIRANLFYFLSLPLTFRSS